MKFKIYSIQFNQKYYWSFYPSNPAWALLSKTLQSWEINFQKRKDWTSINTNGRSNWGIKLTLIQNCLLKNLLHRSSVQNPAKLIHSLRSSSPALGKVAKYISKPKLSVSESNKYTEAAHRMHPQRKHQQQAVGICQKCHSPWLLPDSLINFNVQP